MPWCPKCNEVRESGLMFCPDCGAELIRELTCPQCGRQYRDGTKFCPEDGAEVLPETVAGAEGPEPAAPPPTPEGPLPQKFSLLPGEKILMASRFTYYYKSGALLRGGATYLTQNRLIFCNNHSILFPPVFAGVASFLTAISGIKYKSELWFFLYYFVAYAICLARKPTKITFQVPVARIKSITRKKYGLGAKYTVWTEAGLSYVLQFTRERPWQSAFALLGINLEGVTPAGKPAATDGGAAAAPEAAAPPAAVGARKPDWTPTVVLLTVLAVALGTGLYLWRSYQPAPPKPPVAKPEGKPVAPPTAARPAEPAPQLSALDYFNQAMATKDLSQQILYYTKAIELDPNYIHAYNNRGIAYYLNKDYNNALKDTSKAIELNPQYPFCYNTRGILYYAKKEYTKALSDYNTAISLKKEFHSAYYNRGMVYLSLKKYREALNDFNQTIALKPDYAKAYHQRAQLYNREGNYEQARQDYDKAKSLNPKLPDLVIKRPN